MGLRTPVIVSAVLGVLCILASACGGIVGLGDDAGSSGAQIEGGDDQSQPADASQDLPDQLPGSEASYPGPDSAMEGCYDCTVQQCDTQLTACNADAQCRDILMCLFAEGCLTTDGGTPNLDMLCAAQCCVNAGIPSPVGNPSVKMALVVVQCLDQFCSDPCGNSNEADGGGDAEITLDASDALLHVD